LLSVSVSAQTETEKAAFAEKVVTYLSDSTYQLGVELIRQHLWEELIKEQPIKQIEKDRKEHYLKENYKYLYFDFKREMGSLRREYLAYVHEGAELELYDYSIELQEGKVNFFNGRVRFIMRTDDLQNIVSMEFKAAYVMDLLVLTTPLKEDF
jgi:hypothetical protein